jgi:hypothetical protein
MSQRDSLELLAWQVFYATEDYFASEECKTQSGPLHAKFKQLVEDYRDNQDDYPNFLKSPVETQAFLLQLK